MERTLVVSKFGGTSMGDLPAMEKSAAISIDRNSSVVVVSATSGTTDKLILVAKNASKGNLDECEKTVFEIKEKHLALLNAVSPKMEAKELLNELFTELDLLVQNISLLKELTPKASDHMLSLGERMSSLIFKDVLAKKMADKNVILLDARSVIKTDSNFGKATPSISTIAQECSKFMEFNGENVYVTQGFIGSDKENNTTILGRGGSDYSAALIAEGVSATSLEIWTDVAGVATTDPRLCAEAKIIPELSYQEAGEMAQYGAKILHPATIAPAVRKSIPVFVGSTFDSKLPGTWIRDEVQDRPTVRAITKRGQQALLTISSPKMLNAHGFMAQIFDVFGQHRVSVDCVTTSEISVAITVDHATLENRPFLEQLNKVGEVEIETEYALISLIGHELCRRPNLAKTIFTTINEANIRMMSLGASPSNFNFLVKEDDSKGCIQKLHKVLIEEAR